MNGRRAWLRLYYAFQEAMPDVSQMDPFDGWMAFVAVHDGRCAICFMEDRLVVDHDHGTGLVRGQLCRSCNCHARSGVAHRPIEWDRFAIFTIYCQYPPTAAANARWIYQGSLEPAPQLRGVIWLNTPAGWVQPGSDIWTNNAAAKIGL